VIFFTAADPIVALFTRQADVHSIAVEALRIICVGYIFYGVGMVLVNAFNGAGDTRTPTLLNVFGFWLFQIPLAYLLAKYLKMGPTGVFIAIPAAESAMTVGAFILFKKGRWKKTKV
jgi:Na+-driven multidrug efflux pump